jgi:predicted DNA-binding transcriptional regulator YafY
MIPNISIDAECLYQLAICRDFFMHLLPAGMRKNISAVIKQTAAFLPEGKEMPGSIAQSIIKGHIEYTPLQDTLEAVIFCIEKKLICTISYKSSLQTAKRNFRYAPKRLIAHQGALYISGWIVSEKNKALYGTPTIFAVHRMRQALILNDSSRHLPEPEEDSTDAFGFMKQTPFTARIRFDKTAATYAAERKWSKDQKITKHADGGITLTMTAQSAAECVAWVLSFGETAEILAPDWLRETAAAKARAMAKIYT